MAKALLINPANNLLSNYLYRSLIVPPIPPANLAYLAAKAAEHGDHTVDIHDQFLERTPTAQLARLAVEGRYELVGISCLTTSDSAVCDLGQALRREGFQGKIVLGNTHASVYADSLLRTGWFDIVAHGEGELTFKQLLDNQSRAEPLERIAGISFLSNGELQATQPRELIHNLDSLPHPAWDRLPIGRYNYHPSLFLYEPTLPIQASRGCPYNCFMCAQDALLKPFRRRSPASVVAEIEENIGRYGVRSFGFLDSYFPPDRAWGEEFVRRVRRDLASLSFRFCIEARSDGIDEPLFRELAKIGLHNVAVGFEAGTDESLTRIGKGTTVEQGRRAMDVLRRIKVSTTGFFMIGFPWEDEAMIRRTISYGLDLRPDLLKFNIAVPLPGSRFHDWLIQKSRDDIECDEMTAWTGLLRGSKRKARYDYTSLTDRTLLRLQRKGMIRHYSRPSVLLRLIRFGTLRPRNLLPMALIWLRLLNPLTRGGRQA
ncbi:MAG: radical SAM protein [Candidatus Alcyoniella australis]|nr:radical SAM protein [Candidatus Alcyoniella australis]